MTPTLAAGQLHTRVVIQVATETRDDIGGFGEVWGTLQRRWAKVEPLQGRELLAAQQIEARVTHRVTLRYYAGLTAGHRFLVGTRALPILSVLDLEEYHTVHQCLCMEVV